MSTKLETKKDGGEIKSSGSTLAKREQRLAYTLLLPTLLIIAVIAFYPLGQVFYTSMTDKTFASSEKTSFVGFENYRKLLGMKIKKLPPVIDEETGEQKIDPDTGKKEYKLPIRVLPRRPVRYREVFQFGFFGQRFVVGARDADFIESIWNTLVFTVCSVVLETILGLIIALAMNTNFRGRGVMRATMLVPWAVITVVSARIWEFMLQPSRMGFINMVFEKIGLSDGFMVFLGNETLSLPTMIAIDVWKTTPFMALLILAGLQLIPNSLYEAARVDGAGPLRRFFNITLPLLKPSLAVALVFRTLDALRVFDVFQVLLAQKGYSMATYNYYQLINNRAMGLASAIGVIIFIIIFVFAVLYMKMLGVDTE